MEVKTCPLNRGEIVCCAIKDAKEIFKDTKVSLNFALSYARTYSAEERTKDYSYSKRNIKGCVICSADAVSTAVGSNASVWFYALKQDNYTEELRKEFTQKCLPQIYSVCMEVLNNNTVQDISMRALVELYNGKLIFHKFKV